MMHARSLFTYLCHSSDFLKRQHNGRQAQWTTMYHEDSTNQESSSRKGNWHTAVTAPFTLFTLQQIFHAKQVQHGQHDNGEMCECKPTVLNCAIWTTSGGGLTQFRLIKIGVTCTHDGERLLQALKLIHGPPRHESLCMCSMPWPG